MIAQKTRYALRSLLFLAEEQEGAPVQLGRIAETQRVPPKYLELIMLDLKKAGLVKSARGPKGGYRLARSAEQISFGEVVRTMEGPIALVSCASVNFYAPCGDCQDEATCAIRRAFAILRDQSTTVLTKRKMKTERGLAVSDAIRSSVAGMIVHHLEGRCSAQDRHVRNARLILRRAENDAGGGKGQSRAGTLAAGSPSARGPRR